MDVAGNVFARRCADRARVESSHRASRAEPAPWPDRLKTLETKP